jgi:hypothetical protein
MIFLFLTFFNLSNPGWQEKFVLVAVPGYAPLWNNHAAKRK